MSQVCKECDIDKDVSEYYLIDGCTPFKTCKACIKLKRTNGKPVLNGWQKLTPEIRASVILALKGRRQKVHSIADEHGINYPNLSYWVRTGQCI